MKKRLLLPMITAACMLLMLIQASAADAFVPVQPKMVAYGSISSSGQVEKGAGIESVKWNGTANHYEIKIEDINYFYPNFVTLVSPVGRKTRASHGV